MQVSRYLQSCTAIALSATIFLLPGCAGDGKQEKAGKAKSYQANLKGLNTQLTDGEVGGQVEITRKDDSLSISVTASGLPQGMHLMHLHGFGDTAKATCASIQHDANNDSIVDLIETRAASGITLVPFHENLPELGIEDTTYPVAGSDGTLKYEKTVSFSAVQKALRQKHGIDTLDIADMVVYLHTVPDTTKLPNTVQSLPGVPAWSTVPIACGEFGSK